MKRYGTFQDSPIEAPTGIFYLVSDVDKEMANYKNILALILWAEKNGIKFTIRAAQKGGGHLC